jgi:hypothetical protein
VTKSRLNIQSTGETNLHGCVRLYVQVNVSWSRVLCVVCDDRWLRAYKHNMTMTNDILRINAAQGDLEGRTTLICLYASICSLMRLHFSQNDWPAPTRTRGGCLHNNEWKMQRHFVRKCGQPATLIKCGQLKKSTKAQQDIGPAKDNAV